MRSAAPQRQFLRPESVLENIWLCDSLQSLTEGNEMHRFNLIYILRRGKKQALNKNVCPGSREARCRLISSVSSYPPFPVTRFIFRHIDVHVVEQTESGLTWFTRQMSDVINPESDWSMVAFVLMIRNLLSSSWWLISFLVGWFVGTKATE